MSKRQLVSSGSPFEPEIGFSRGVRIGSHIAVSGTAPIAAGGGVAAPGDAHGQTRRCLEIIEATLQQAGGSLEDVIRTRVMLAQGADWRAAARAHGEVFKDVRPATTMVQVGPLIAPDFLVEISAIASLALP